MEEHISVTNLLTKCLENMVSGDECLKHSYSTRVSLSFPCLFYINYIVFGVQIPYLVFVLNTGTMERKEQR